MNFNRISRTMSRALRHEPECLGINLDRQGWVDANELYNALKISFPSIQDFRYEHLEDIIRDCPKQRFAWNEEHTKIRANQGHSLGIDLQLLARTPEETLFHGTSTGTVGMIWENGLLKMERDHVHLSSDKDTAVKVGSRHGKPVIFTVLARQHFFETGTPYFLSENGVWLVDHVPAKYLVQDSPDGEYFIEEHVGLEMPPYQSPILKPNS